MEKREFIEKYNIRAAVPIDPSLRVLPAEGFAQAIEEFINERFKGAARARAVVSTTDAVLVSPEYAALFLKLLLAEVYGRQLLNVEITNDKDRLTMLITSDEALPLSDKSLRNLIRVARSSGMQIYPDESSIKLTLLFSDAAIRQVYAISVNDGKRIMLAKLCEIFFSGEYYQGQ